MKYSTAARWSPGFRLSLCGRIARNSSPKAGLQQQNRSRGVCGLQTTLTLLLLTVSVPAWAQPQVRRELKGQLFEVVSGQQDKRPLVGVKVTIRETGNSGLTSDEGLFRIPLPDFLKSGQEITVLQDKADYAIRDPLFGKQRIPANLSEVIELRAIPKGSPLFFTHPEIIERFVERTASESVKQMSAEPRRDKADLSAYILELANHYGLTEREVRDEIGQWRETAKKDHTNFRKLGLAAFAEENFAFAAESFLRSAQINDREAARDYDLAGDAFYNALKFDEALTAYQDAWTRTPPRGDVRWRHYLSAKLANARAELGIRVAGAAARAHLKGAIAEYKCLLDDTSRRASPEDWAALQSNLGTALLRHGIRQEGADGLKSLADAVTAYRDALQVSTRETLPDDWAETQNNLGNALSLQGTRQEGAEGLKSLADAVTACRNALEVQTRETVPEAWATTQNSLGIALSELGRRQEWAESLKSLAGAVAAYRDALTVWTRETLPQAWAAAQNNLGIALSELGTRHESAEGLKSLADAVRACREALQVYTRETMPQAWAMTQNNLGNALSRQGRRQEGAESLKSLADAVTACREALQVHTRETLPQAWAATQHNLGNALCGLGTRQKGAEGLKSLADAVTAYRDALQILTRETLPQAWAASQANLGNALCELGTRQKGAEGLKSLADSVTAYRAALQVYTRKRLPQDRARTQNNLGTVLCELGTRQEGADGLKSLADAVTAYRDALQVHTREAVPQNWAMTQNNLGSALWRLGTRQEGADGLKSLVDALTACREALQVYTRESLPQDWAMAQDNLGSALWGLGTRQEGAKGLELLAQAAAAYRNALEVCTQDVSPYYPGIIQTNLLSVESERTYRSEMWQAAAEYNALLLGVQPFNREAYRRAASASHEHLFEFEKAFQLHRIWLENHQEDVPARLNFTETHFTTTRFRDGIKRIEELTGSEEVRRPPTPLAAMRCLEIACQTALGQPAKARTAMASLIDVVQIQTPEFRVAWTWNGTRHFIETAEVDTIKQNRACLLSLIDAVSAENRDAILGKLKEVEKAMPRE